jgi:type VI secretion system secreted protein VgrG
MTQVKTTIKLAGWSKSLTVNSLSIQQAYNRHHSFELIALLPENYFMRIKRMEELLGDEADIRIKPEKGSKGEVHFKGFVDQANVTWAGESRALRIKGFSPSIFLDCGPRFRTFGERSLSGIVHKICGEYGNQFPGFSKLEGGDQVFYSVQAQETDYSYLCRIADHYGKVFYYDGAKMYFGKWGSSKGNPLQLSQKKDIKQLELATNLAPLKFKISGYEIVKSKIFKEPHNDDLSATGLLQAAVKESGKYPTSDIFLTHLIKDQSELDATAKRIRSRQAHDLIQMSATSDHMGLKIGGKIQITETQDMKSDLLSGGTFIITDVSHSVSSDQSYRNSFTAVPAGLPFAIRMQQARNPVSGPLMAVVKETNDPEKLGRVKVEFQGDPEKTLSPWLRVLVPYTKYGGFFFKPEKEDKVVAFFEDFNAEKMPFIMGSFYHGKATADIWDDPDNKKKGIVTEKIKFDFNDRTGKLEISADAIELKAKKIDVNAEDTMKVDGGKHLTLSGNRIDLNP